LEVERRTISESVSGCRDPWKQKRTQKSSGNGSNRQTRNSKSMAQENGANDCSQIINQRSDRRDQEGTARIKNRGKQSSQAKEKRTRNQNARHDGAFDQLLRREIRL